MTVHGLICLLEMNGSFRQWRSASLATQSTQRSDEDDTSGRPAAAASVTRPRLGNRPVSQYGVGGSSLYGVQKSTVQGHNFRRVRGHYIHSRQHICQLDRIPMHAQGVQIQNRDMLSLVGLHKKEWSRKQAGRHPFAI